LIHRHSGGAGTSADVEQPLVYVEAYQIGNHGKYRQLVRGHIILYRLPLLYRYTIQAARAHKHTRQAAIGKQAYYTGSHWYIGN
jgi:hypothetical protein